MVLNSASMQELVLKSISGCMVHDGSLTMIAAFIALVQTRKNNVTLTL